MPLWRGGGVFLGRQSYSSPMELFEHICTFPEGRMVPHNIVQENGVDLPKYTLHMAWSRGSPAINRPQPRGAALQGRLRFVWLGGVSSNTPNASRSTWFTEVSTLYLHVYPTRLWKSVRLSNGPDLFGDTSRTEYALLQWGNI